MVLWRGLHSCYRLVYGDFHGGEPVHHVRFLRWRGIQSSDGADVQDHFFRVGDLGHGRYAQAEIAHDGRDAIIIYEVPGCCCSRTGSKSVFEDHLYFVSVLPHNEAAIFVDQVGIYLHGRSDVLSPQCSGPGKRHDASDLKRFLFDR